MNSRSSFSCGLGIEYSLTQKLDLLVECDYISKGYKFYSNQPTSYGPYTRVIYDEVYKHNYLEFPVLLKKYFGKGRIQYYINGGGYLGIGLGGTRKGEFGIYDRGFADVYRNFDGKIKYGSRPQGNGLDDDLYYDRRVDCGILGGVGLVFFKLVAIDVRYDLGLINIDKGDNDYKNRTFQLAVSVPLKLDYVE